MSWIRSTLGKTKGDRLGVVRGGGGGGCCKGGRVGIRGMMGSVFGGHDMVVFNVRKGISLFFCVF